MFKIKLIKEYPFKIVVKGYSKINSLVVNVVSKPYKIYSDLKMYLKSNSKITSTTRVIIDKIRLITKLRTSVKHSNANINAMFSSKEKIGADVRRKVVISNMLRSKEKISGVIVRKSKMVLSPVVGYFKKLYESDNRSLQDLDNISLRDMDYEMMLMANSDSGEEVI